MTNVAREENENLHTHTDIPSDDLHETLRLARSYLVEILDCASQLHAQDNDGLMMTTGEVDRVFGDLSRAAQSLRLCFEAIEPQDQPKVQ